MCLRYCDIALSTFNIVCAVQCYYTQCMYYVCLRYSDTTLSVCNMCVYGTVILQLHSVYVLYVSLRYSDTTLSVCNMCLRYNVSVCNMCVYGTVILHSLYIISK